MKKLFGLVFILSALLPLYSSAQEGINHTSERGVKSLSHPIIDKRQSMQECAQGARTAANAHLDRAWHLLDDLKSVKDWRLKERLQVLIGSWITATPIKDPRAKVLAVALGMLADLVIKEGFEKSEIIYEIHIELSCAVSCLAECQYYNHLSLEAQDDAEFVNSGWKYTNFAIDSLTLADMLTISLEQRSMYFDSKGIGDSISHYILRIRKALMGDMIQNRQLTHDYLSDVGTLLENYDEIVAEVHRRDRGLAEQIRSVLNNAVEYLKLAEREWRIRQ